MNEFLSMMPTKIIYYVTFYLAFGLVRVDLSMILAADFLLVLIFMT